MNRTERLLDLITYLLNAPKPVSWQEIKNHFPDDYARGVEESNQRKFERDKAELISLGIPIDYLSGSEYRKEGYLIRKERLFLPEIEFAPQESSLLMLTADAVRENENFPYRDQLESALHKIISTQTHVNRPPSELMITYSGKPTGFTVGPVIQQIQDALDRRKSIEIRYHAFSTGEVTTRKVDPYGLIFRKGKWTLVAFDRLRRDLRTFVVNRISRCRVNPRKPGTPDYRIPKHFSLKAYQDFQPWELEIHPPLKVRIQVAEHRLPELLPQLKGAREIDERAFELSVSNRQGLISWVLSQKTDVFVLEPPQIQNEIRQVLQSLT